MKRKTTWMVTGAATLAAVAGASGIAAAVSGGDSDSPVAGPDRERAVDAATAEVAGGTVSDVELDDGRYEVEIRRDDGTEVDVILDQGFGVVATDEDVDGPDDEEEKLLTGETLDQATAAALEATGGGTVTDTEADDGGYEVEVRREDGTEVDVQLDDRFTVTAQDVDGPEDE